MRHSAPEPQGKCGKNHATWPAGRAGLTGPRKARPDDRLRRNPPLLQTFGRAASTNRIDTSFAQPTPNQISARKMVTTDMAVETTMAGETVSI